MANTLAYGFVGLENMFAQRLDDSNVQTIREAIGLSVAEHNRQVQAIMAELVEATEDYTVRYRVPGSGTLQPLDEYGNPLPVREVGYYDVAFPIQGGGTAWGDNRVTRALLEVEEVNEMVVNSLQRDSDWMKRHILAAILDDTAWTYPDPDKGDLTVVPMANGDTVTYLKRSGTVETDDHYLATASAIADDANPFTGIFSELKEHPENKDASVVVYIPTALKATTVALTNFVEVADPNIVAGSASSVLVGSVDRGFGDELLGKVDGCWIVEWTLLPDEHMIAVARGSSRPALKMREYPAASLKGFFQEDNSPDGNLEEHRFIRYAGFGGFNRVAVVVQQVGNSTYEIPSGYSTPLAV